MGLKQVWSCFVFPREFSSLFRASRVQLGLLRSFSCGDLRWLASLSRDVTGKALLTILDFVAPLRLWHSLRPPSDGWFGCESLAGRLPGQPCARLSAPSSGAPESCKREEKREETRTRVVFSTVRFGRRPPAADRIRLSVWGGAPPMSMVFLQGIFDGEKNNF